MGGGYRTFAGQADARTRPVEQAHLGLARFDTDRGEHAWDASGGRTHKLSQRSSMQSGTGTGGVDAKVIHASGGRSREDEESRTLADTDEARFDRLLRAVSTDPEGLGWVEVTEPDVNFDKIGIEPMVSWECDLYIPQIVQGLAKSGEAAEAIGMMQALLPTAKSLGLDMKGLLDDEQMSAVAGFASGMNASLLVVGENDETDWRVAAQLPDDFLHGD